MAHEDGTLRSGPYTFRPMTLADARAMARWRYDGPYAFYNLSSVAMLTLAVAQRVAAPLLAGMFYTVCDEAGELAGGYSFLRRHGGSWGKGIAMEIGIALRPERTGRGEGLGYVHAGLDFARRRYAPPAFVLDVATFNRRAIRVYERAGFQHIRTFNRFVHGRPVEHWEMWRET